MSIAASAQQVLSPETLWKLGRVSVLGISKDKKSIVYKVATPSIEENKSNSNSTLFLLLAEKLLKFKIPKIYL